jgi:acyl-CoA synthetase (AMP-forming)/AMP-acid ligase II
LTETAGALAIPRRGWTSPVGSVAKLLPNTQLRVVDPNSGRDMGVNEQGELWARGPQVMKGYLNNPAATAAMVDSDGWLHTGDLGRVDEDGCIYLTGRLKELIKVSSYQVAPAELEGLLITHPAVADVAVVGRPDEVRGEAPVAFVVKRNDVSAAELKSWLASRVTPYKRVRDVRFVDAIPKSPAGKILRRLLV